MNIENIDKRKNHIPQAELAKQKYYMQAVRELNGRGLKACVSTFGCQMNAHDSEKLKGMLVEMGYEDCADEKDADFILYNTCCVRENAENKVYGNLGFLMHVKKEKKDLRIVLCGCMMQQGAVIEKIKKSYRHVDIIFGTYNLHKLPELLYRNISSGGQIIDVWEEHGDIVEDLPVKREDKYRAGVNITYGCDNFCSYCIVPYVRGRERSRTPEDVLDEVKRLAADGVKEITLLGQNVNSYGKGLESGTDFAKLLRLVHEIEGIERIRFMTSHPKDLSDELIDTLSKLPKVCRHVHLPVQSGSTDVLGRMNRKYTKEDYLALVSKLKEKVPEVSISTDIIVGFPGESENDFLDTLDVVKKVKFNAAFTFVYSKRSGTPAALMTEEADEETIKNRFDRLVNELNGIILELNKSYIGKTVKVLAVETQENGMMSGRTDGNIIVHFKGSTEDLGRIIDVKITDVKTFYMAGEKA